MTPFGRVWLAAALDACVLTALGADRYLTYHSGADLGEFVQAISSVFGGFADTPEGGSHFLHHFSPLLYLCAPLLLATHSALALVAMQAVAGALVAPAIFLFARRRCDEPLAAAIAMATLLYPPLVGVTFTDFHENGFAPAAIAWLIWAIDARRWRLAATFAALALAIKEDQAAILAVIGAGFALVAARRRDAASARFGAGLALVSAAVFVGYFALVRPLAGAHGTWFALDYYSGTGHESGTAHGTSALVGRLTFLLEAFGPLAFVPFASPWLALAVPGLAEVLASRWSITYTMGQHYAGVWIGYVLIAFGAALAAIARTRPARARTLLRLVVALCVLNLAVASPTHWGHFLGWRTAHDAALDRIVARVPPGAAVGTVDEIYAHLGFDPRAQIGLDGAPEYALFDAHYDSAAWRTIYAPQLRDDLARDLYRPVDSEDGVTLYRRDALPGTPSSGAKSAGDGRGSEAAGPGAGAGRAFACRGRNEQERG